MELFKLERLEMGFLEGGSLPVLDGRQYRYLIASLGGTALLVLFATSAWTRIISAGFLGGHRLCGVGTFLKDFKITNVLVLIGVYLNLTGPAMFIEYFD